MLRKDPGPERKRLGFQDTVKSNFRFLERYGLELVESNSTLVKYESSRVFVRIYHGRVSFELGVELGEVSDPLEKAVSIFDVVDAEGASDREGLSGHTVFQVSSKKDLEELMPKLSSLVQKYAGPLLRGDRHAYERVREHQSRKAARETREVQLTAVRRKAEAAWQKRDYARLIELFRPWRQYLIGSEAKKLAYAERHSSAAASPSVPTGQERIGNKGAKKRPEPELSGKAN